MAELPSLDEFEISPARLSELLEENPEAIRLIDCREEDEFALCKIEGAELLPLSTFAESGGPALLSDESKPAVIYCHHGMRSLQTTMFVRQRGRADVWSLAGGIDLWSQEIDPTVPRY
ncbi:MAG: rhodanese [Verrucomicrobiales bacterium]|nr:rhodanese [Verrucomicrobiales bacterium]